MEERSPIQADRQMSMQECTLQDWKDIEVCSSGFFSAAELNAVWMHTVP